MTAQTSLRVRYAYIVCLITAGCVLESTSWCGFAVLMLGVFNSCFPHVELCSHKRISFLFVKPLQYNVLHFLNIGSPFLSTTISVYPILFSLMKIFWVLSPRRFVTPMFWRYVLPPSFWQIDVHVDNEVQCHRHLSKPQKIPISSNNYRETLRLMFTCFRLSSLLLALQPDGCYWSSHFLKESMFMIHIRVLVPP
jgi:hypothetical protein